MIHGTNALRAGLALAAVGLSLAACSPTTNVRGHVMDERLVNAIQPGVDDQASVRAMLGTPSVMGTFNGNRWYYVSRTTETLAFFRPDVLDHKVVMVAFDDSGVVRDVQRSGIEQTQKIDPVNDKTPTRGRELGFWEQIFGNIGRFSGAPATPGP